MVRVSVVIPAYNEEKLLPATLAAVDQARAAWTRRGWDSEVVVCNNNSTDRTA
ncbi:MAG: glycosyltransferase family 2 protein, partial [Verrucomicrobiota bacterium]